MEPESNLKSIRKAYITRTRQTSFIEGIYRIKHPLLIFLRPKIYFIYNKKRTKAKAILVCFGKRFPLSPVKNKGIRLVYTYNIDSIPIDMVIRFYKRDAFEGFFDTPIGQFRISGIYIQSLYTERSSWKRRKKEFK